MSNNLEAQLDPLFDAAIDSKRIPGVAAMVLDASGTVLFSKSYGTVNSGDPDAQKFSVQSPHMVCSCTKLLTSVAALQLFEQGKLAFDDDVEKYVPQIAQVQVLDGFDEDGTPQLRAPRTKVKVVHLLTHTTGLTYDFFDKATLRFRVATHQPAGVYENWQAFTAPMIADPGTRFKYGVNTDWLGLVIQGITGQPVTEYIDQNIIQPLGLKATGLCVKDTTPEYLHIHMKNARGTLTPTDTRVSADAEVVPGGHYLTSSCEDYTQFLLTILNMGTHPTSKVTLLQPETVRKYIFSDQIHLAGCSSQGVGIVESSIPQISTEGEFLPGVAKSWSLALMVNSEDVPNGRPAGSAGWAGLGNNYYWMDPVNGKLGMVTSAIFPFFDRDVLHLFDALERAVYGKPAAHDKGAPGSNFAGGVIVAP